MAMSRLVPQTGGGGPQICSGGRVEKVFFPHPSPWQIDQDMVLARPEKW